LNLVRLPLLFDQKSDYTKNATQPGEANGWKHLFWELDWIFSAKLNDSSHSRSRSSNHEALPSTSVPISSIAASGNWLVV
jgi:hypothetical protein